MNADKGTRRQCYIVNCLDFVAWIRPIPSAAISIYRRLPLSELKQNVKGHP
jgi:hypothetical protein